MIVSLTSFYFLLLMVIPPTLLFKLVSILLSCLWFSLPLSWEQWIGAVKKNLPMLKLHSEAYHGDSGPNDIMKCNLQMHSGEGI
ncbi:hypothetical protein V6N13_082690 [Hibiscus sabdariffa]